MDMVEYKNKIIEILNEHNARLELSKTVDSSYYNPGMMENLDQYYGQYDTDTNQAFIKTEVKGLRYDNRSYHMDDMVVGNVVDICREPTNEFNPNNFSVKNLKGESLGSLSASICDALAPLVDAGYAKIVNSKVSYMEKISERSRYAKQGILFVQFTIVFLGV